MEDSSALVSVASHLRETTSRMAIEARRARVQWVKSYAQMEFGFQVSHSGHGLRGAG